MSSFWEQLPPRLRDLRLSRKLKLLGDGDGMLLVGGAVGVLRQG